MFGKKNTFAFSFCVIEAFGFLILTEMEAIYFVQKCRRSTGIKQYSYREVN